MKKTLCLFWVGLCIVTAGWSQQNFDSRLEVIKHQLNILSDSTVEGLNGSVNFTVSNVDIQQFLRSIAETHNINISVDPGLKISITNNFTNATVKDVLYFLCRQYKLDITFVNTILSFSAYEAPEKAPVRYQQKKLNIVYNPANSRVTIELAQDSLALFARQFTEVTNRNVILAPGLSNETISGYVKNVTIEQALEQISFSNGLSFSKTKDGFFVIARKEPAGNAKSSRNASGSLVNSLQGEGQLDFSYKVINGDTLVSIDMVNVPILAVIGEVSQEINKDFFISAPLSGSITGKMKDISFDNLLDLLLRTTEYTYKKEKGVYIIGSRMQEGLRKTEVVKLQFRTVDAIETFIPQELTKGIQLTVFRDLNSIILSGGAPQIDEIIAFIRAIDEPVPNILIEVIVVDVREGFNIETGIRAFLSDSVPNTSGQVFPGLDVTLSSKSINNALDELNKTGIVNLGKVTPKFYTTLKALEANNNLDVKSTPKLSTLNGHEANLKIGQSVYFIQQTQNINPGVNPITTISQQFRQVEANLSININPIVSGNEHITLNIEAEFSDFIAPEFENAPPGNATRKFISKIRVKNEEMIVLGGLEETRKSESSSGFPVLSRIPILKWLFSSRSKEKDDKQLVIFIKPTVVY
ncbi:hypothetical protein LVD17_18985 [Fulvivirga ulvae]|uniref:hypothetical protein n=1 Tax=Fulvivirga ulvae TaxID=2904245 RepID=UPI001F43267B|nr:hypothetical protein [Fulvivirga ulvae]UII30379.1 hypothetical protein LVD17_18985 [Fulvivirga ulvae]